MIMIYGIQFYVRINCPFSLTVILPQSQILYITHLYTLLENIFSTSLANCVLDHPIVSPNSAEPFVVAMLVLPPNAFMPLNEYPDGTAANCRDDMTAYKEI